MDDIKIEEPKLQETPGSHQSKAVVPILEEEVIEDDDFRKSTLKEAEKVKNASITEKISMAKKIKEFTKGPSLASKDADSLELFEDENDQRHWSRHIQKVVMGVVALVLFIHIFFSNLSLIGT